jgi:hypothetical protein
MPLPTPYAYVVSYDLTMPAARYAPFFQELGQSYKWWHFLTTTWIVIRYDTLVELGNKLRPLIFEPDRLLITPARGPADGWLSAEAWQWIQSNVPNEW